MPWKEKEISGARLSFVACGGAFNEKSTRVLVTRTRPPEFSLIFSTRMSHDFTTRKGRHTTTTTRKKQNKNKKGSEEKSSSRNEKDLKTRANGARAQSGFNLQLVCVCCLCRPTFGFHRRSEWEMSRLDGNDGSPFSVSF